jgi:UDPglucose 6-dehydrogenase
MTTVSVVGLGKLGACMAACFAHKSLDVVGVDADPAVVDAVNAGLAPVKERGLSEMIAASSERLRATRDCLQAVRSTDATFIVVPTPSEEDGALSLRYVKAVAREIAAGLAAKEDYHLVVVTSTVLPGSTDFGVRRILERESGKVCGPDFGLCYGPEFIALGTVIHDFLNPDFVLIGESDERAGRTLSDLYGTVLDNEPPVARMNFVNAELAKIAVNTFLTTKITFANMLAAMCEQLPGGDVDAVTAALGLDSRIGPRYLKGGLSYGGPCFPRDNLALSYFARQIASNALLAQATDSLNRELAKRLVVKVAERAQPGVRVAVLGAAYKPLSNVVEESAGVGLADALSSAGIDAVVFDPLAEEAARRVLGDRVGYAATVAEALEGAEVVVVANPDPAFRLLTQADFPRRPVVVFDCWRGLRGALTGVEGIEYVALGLGGPGDERP